MRHQVLSASCSGSRAPVAEAGSCVSGNSANGDAANGAAGAAARPPGARWQPDASSRPVARLVTRSVAPDRIEGIIGIILVMACRIVALQGIPRHRCGDRWRNRCRNRGKGGSSTLRPLSSRLSDAPMPGFQPAPPAPRRVEFPVSVQMGPAGPQESTKGWWRSGRSCAISSTVWKTSGVTCRTTSGRTTSPRPTGPASKSSSGDRRAHLVGRRADRQADLAVAKTATIQGAIVERPPEQPGPPEEIMAIPIVFIMFVLGPLAIAYARRIWKRGATVVAPVPGKSDRLDQMAQAVESIAIETEAHRRGPAFPHPGAERPGTSRRRRRPAHSRAGRGTAARRSRLNRSGGTGPPGPAHSAGRGAARPPCNPFAVDPVFEAHMHAHRFDDRHCPLTRP